MRRTFTKYPKNILASSDSADFEINQGVLVNYVLAET